MAILKGAEPLPMKKGFYVDRKGYVFRAKAVYDKALYREKGRGTVNGKVYVGKSIGDGKSFVPNSRFYELYPEEKPAEAPLPAPRQDPALKLGSYAVIRSVARKSGLLECLGTAFAKEDGTSDAEKTALIMDVVSYMVQDGTSSMQHFPAFAFDHVLFSGRIATDSEIGALFAGITEDEIGRFLKSWAERNRAAEDGSLFVCYDSTNFNSVSEGITLVERGYAKDDKDKPQFNFECVVRAKDGTPLAYDTFPGSLVDVSQCSSMVKRMKEYGYKDVTFICDRGYISQKNIKAMKKNGYSYVLVVKDNLVLKKDIVSEHYREIVDNSACYLRGRGLFAKSYRVEIYEGVTAWAHVYCTAEVGIEAIENLHRLVDEKEKDLSEMVGHRIETTKAQLERSHGRFFDLSYGEEQGEKLILKSYARNDAKISAEMQKLRFKAMVTDSEMTAAQALDTYKPRDVVEKDFMSLKTGFSMNTVGTHSDATTRGKMFVAFIALIVRCAISKAMAELRERKKDRKTYTVLAAMGELNKILGVRDVLSQGRRRIRYVLTNRQKTILSPFGVTEQTLSAYLEEYEKKGV